MTLQHLTFFAGIYSGAENAKDWTARLTDAAMTVFRARGITDLVMAENAYIHRQRVRSTGNGHEIDPARADAWEAALTAVNAVRGRTSGVSMHAIER